MKKSIRAHIFIFAAIRVVINTKFRMVYPFLPAFRDGLGVSIKRLSLALTWRSLMGMFGPLIANVSESRGRKAGMLLGLFLFSIGVASVVILPNFTGFTIALILTIFGKYAFDSAMQAYLADNVSYERRGFSLAITELGWSGSFFIGIPIAGLLIAKRGWLAPFPLLALLGALSFALLFWLIPPDPKRTEKPPSFLKNMGMVFSSTSAMAGLGVTLFLSASNEMVNLIFGVWMEASFGLQIAALGAASAVIGFAELAGEGLVSALVDRLGKKRALSTGISMISISAIILPVLGRSLPGALVGLFFFYITFEFTFVSSLPLMTEVLPAARATLMAINLGSASLGRALATMFATQVYAYGIEANAAVSMLINILALIALRWVRVEGE